MRELAEMYRVVEKQHGAFAEQIVAAIPSFSLGTFYINTTCTYTWSHYSIVRQNSPPRHLPDAHRQKRFTRLASFGFNFHRSRRILIDDSNIMHYGIRDTAVFLRYFSNHCPQSTVERKSNFLAYYHHNNTSSVSP